jgi:hypothetical protein
VPAGRWTCFWHACWTCGRKASYVGNILFRCIGCPMARCFDCLPPDFEPGEVPQNLVRRLEAHGMSTKSTVFYFCSDCEDYKEEVLQFKKMQKHSAKLQENGSSKVQGNTLHKPKQQESAKGKQQHKSMKKQGCIAMSHCSDPSPLLGYSAIAMHRNLNPSVHCREGEHCVYGPGSASAYAGRAIMDGMRPIGWGPHSTGAHSMSSAQGQYSLHSDMRPSHDSGQTVARDMNWRAPFSPAVTSEAQQYAGWVQRNALCSSAAELNDGPDFAAMCAVRTEEIPPAMGLDLQRKKSSLTAPQLKTGLETAISSPIPVHGQGLKASHAKLRDPSGKVVTERIHTSNTVAAAEMQSGLSTTASLMRSACGYKPLQSNLLAYDGAWAGAGQHHQITGVSAGQGTFNGNAGETVRETSSFSAMEFRRRQYLFAAGAVEGFAENPSSIATVELGRRAQVPQNGLALFPASRAGQRHGSVYAAQTGQNRSLVHGYEAGVGQGARFGTEHGIKYGSSAGKGRGSWYGAGCGGQVGPEAKFPPVQGPMPPVGLVSGSPPARLAQSGYAQSLLSSSGGHRAVLRFVLRYWAKRRGRGQHQQCVIVQCPGRIQGLHQKHAIKGKTRYQLHPARVVCSMLGQPHPPAWY